MNPPRRPSGACLNLSLCRSIGVALLTELALPVTPYSFHRKR
jgi:hypothetical protein